MGTRNPGRVNVVTTPWSANWLTHNAEDPALTDLGFSAYTKTLIGPPTRDAWFAAIGTNAQIAASMRQDRVYDVRWAGAVGDGVTDDTAAFAAAVDAVPSGGCLLIPRGTWRITSRITRSSPITIMGVGDGSVIEYGAGDVGMRLDGDDSTVAHLCISGSASSGLLFGFAGTLFSPARNARVLDCTFRGTVNQCIWLWNIDGVQVRGCRFETGYGVIAQYGVDTLARNVLVDGCLFRLWRRDGVCVNLHASVAGYSAGWQITNNNFDTHADWGGTPTTESRAMSFSYAKDCVVSGNRIRRVATSGLGAIHFEGISGECIFASNTIEDCLGNGWLEIVTSDCHLQILGNLFRCTASGNGSTAGMIRMADASYNSRVSIVGNRFTQDGTGRDCDGIVIRDAAVTGWQVVGNRFERLGRAIWGKSNARLLNVQSNYFVGCNHGILASPQSASGGSNHDWLVGGNYWYDTQTRDIEVGRNSSGTSGSERWMVTGNFFDAVGISGGGTADFTVVGNFAPSGVASFTLGGSSYGAPSTGYIQYGNRNVDMPLDGSIVWDPANMADGAGETSGDITVTGAAFGDFVEVAAPYDLQGIVATGYVRAADTVRIRLQNETGGAIDLPSGTWRVRVNKR